MSDLDYLQDANIVRLTAAARMAGLRFKNGTLDKQGIIQRLSEHPSILRATVATLERMGRGEGLTQRAPVSFGADDFSDDTLTDATIIPDDTPAPQAQQASRQASATVDLSQYVKRAEHASDMTRLAAGLGARIETRADEIQASVAEALANLKERRPIQFVFPSKASVTIDPTEHHESFPKLVKYLEINRRVILTGSAGTGKSMACKNAAEALGVKFYLLPPVTMGHELIGHRDAQGVFHETPLTRAFKHGGLCLLDESDASLPDALLVANPILDGNGFAMLGDGEMHSQHPDFLAVFNMNTDGNGATMQYSGRNRLDGATLARFGVRIQWNIDARIETMMAGGQKDWHKVIVAVRDFMVARDIVDVNATPRHLKTGAALLNAGLPRGEILEDVLKSGALAAVWAEMLRLQAVQIFLRG